MALRAVLFDMDGLLVRTEETWLAVEYEVMAALGGFWGPEHQRALLGSSLGTSARYLRELAGSEVAPEQVAEMLLAGMARRLRAGPVTWMPGAQELRAAGVPCGLVPVEPRAGLQVVRSLLEVELGGMRAHADTAIVAESRP
ncbi:MAG: hypothetical protein M3P96_00190 [Actinomycetota bacterium]|nr:hypothetical protein [Actinomycetota bacterium]